VLEFLDISDIKWKSLFKSTKKERTVVFIASYLLAGTIFFIIMPTYNPEYISGPMGVGRQFLLYWLVLLIIPLLLSIIAVSSVSLFIVVMIPFCIPFLFLWLGARSKSRVYGITSCAISGSILALLCFMGFYILGQWG